MASTADSVRAHDGPGRVLVVGDINKVFFDADNVDRYPCEVRTNVLDAIHAATGGGFDVVGIVLEGASSGLGAALRALRANTTARIVLLAQMYEEPIARRLAGEVSGEGTLADSYLICPTRLDRLCGTAGIPSSANRHAAAPTDRQSTSVEFGAGPAAARAERRIRQLEQLATTDDLTGLKNRRYILEFARQALEYAQQDDGRVTLLVFDIDNFKHYNDEYGHLTGDEILKQAALLMRRCCRTHDVVGRIGGDEFAVVFWDDPHGAVGQGPDRRSAEAEHPKQAISVARRFQNAFGNADLHLLGPRGEGVLTISGGLASFPRDGQTVHDLLKKADAALLDAKRSGKNRIYLVGQPQNDIADLS